MMFPLHDDNPTKHFPYVTIVFIAICVAVFLWQFSLGDENYFTMVSLGMIPAVLFNINNLSPELEMIPAWLTIFTSMFMHANWLHLVGNMLYLWVFANNVEDSMGHKRFIVFYILCGIVAAVAHASVNPASETPMVGASGAISGVLGAYLLLYPRARVLVVIPIFIIMYPVKIAAGWVLVFWFVMQIFNSLMTAGQENGIAFGAHIGGFVAGIIFIGFFKRRNVKFFAPIRR